MKRLSIGTISALFLAGAVSPAVLATTNETFLSGDATQNQSVSQLPGSPQTPGQGSPSSAPGTMQTPGQPAPGQPQTPGTGQTPRPTQTPGQVLPGQTPGQFPPGSAPGTMQTPGQTPGQPAPGQPQTPGQVPPRQTPGQSPSQFPPGAAPGTMQLRPDLEPGAMLSPDAVSPFQLTSMASRGQLEDAGIGGGTYFRNQVRIGNIRGRDIVEAAANQGYISRAVVEDGSYIGHVNQFLRMQERDWRN